MGRGEVSRADLKMLRKAGVNVVYGIDGRGYFGTGGGMTMSGHSVIDSDCALSFLRAIKRIEKLILSSEFKGILKEFYCDKEDFYFDLDLDSLFFEGVAILSEKSEPKVRISILCKHGGFSVLESYWMLKLNLVSDKKIMKSPSNFYEALIQVD